MAIVSLALIGVLLAVGHVLWQVIYNIFLHPLRDIPGPLLWRAFDFPFTLASLKGTIHIDLRSIHEQYGPRVRVAPNDVSHTTGDVWKDVWGHVKGNDEFPKFTNFVPINGVHGILTADRLAHRRYRHHFSHAFSQQGLLSQESRVVGHIDGFIEQLKTQTNNGSQNMVSWFDWLTFDIIADLSFGESFYCIRDMRTHPWIDALMKGVKASVVIMMAARYGLVGLLMRVLPKKFAEARRKGHEFLSGKIQQRMEYTGEPRGDLLDKVLTKPLDDVEKSNLMHPDERYLNRLEIESISGNFVLAGSETTATLLAGLVYQLLTHPDIHEKLVKEIRETFASSEDITIATANEKSPYMLQVLNEGLRIYPPVPMIFGREVPAQGATISGQFYPAGTKMQVCAMASNFMESNFARPNEFIPERWAPREQRHEEFLNDNADGAFQPFSTGPRNCIGRNLAYAEQRVILAKLLWNFDLSIPKDVPNWNQWTEKQRVFVLWDKSPLMVDVRVREGA